MLNKDRHPWLHHSSIVQPSRGGPAIGIYTPVHSSSAKTFQLIFCFQLFVGPQYAISTYGRYVPNTLYSGYTHHIPYIVMHHSRHKTSLSHAIQCTHSLPTHKKLSKINIVFDFLTTEYFLNLACVKFKPITHIIAKFHYYTTLAWVRFKLKIPIRINLRTTVRIGRGNLLLVMNNTVLLQCTTAVMHLAETNSNSIV